MFEVSKYILGTVPGTKYVLNKCNLSSFIQPRFIQRLPSHESKIREMQQFGCCSFRELLRLCIIKAGICERFERYFALKEREKQPEKLMLMHAVQNNSRFRVGTRIG